MCVHWAHQRRSGHADSALLIEIKALETRREAIKAALLDRATSNTIAGALYRVSVSASTRETLDVNAARKQLGTAWVARHTKSTPITSLRATLIAASAIPLAA